MSVPRVHVTPITAIDDHGNRVSALAVKTPYSADFVEQLKDLVPGRDRNYNPANKTWVVDASYKEEVLDLIEECFTGDFQAKRQRDWEKLLETWAEKYCKMHYRKRAFRERGVPVKEALLAIMDQSHIPTSQYNALYQLCRKKIPEFYPWYVKQVLLGKIER